MRKSVPFRLKWEHINWENAYFEIVQPKSKRANEKITITSSIKSILEDQLEVFKNSQFPDKDLGYVFSHQKGCAGKKSLDQYKLFIRGLELKQA